MADGATDSEAFRSELRAWLEAHCPASMRTPMPDDEVVWGGRTPSFKNPASKLWLEAMAAKGFTSSRTSCIRCYTPCSSAAQASRPNKT